MNESSAFRECDHLRCAQPHNYRQEYCEVDGQDPDGEVQVVLEILEEVLYPENDQTHDSLRHEADHEGSSSLRTFTLPDGLAVSLLHIQEKATKYHRYDIVAETPPHLEHPNDTSHRIEYSIDMYPGTLDANVTEYGLTIKSVLHPNFITTEERPMTPYDYGALFQLLTEIYDLQNNSKRKRSTFDNDPGN